ncbi:transposase [Paenibacillus xylanexedens]|uniref:transposase n=1 Tax=Paenibacillus xylanexedens TaxID=528191 RepID=UPI0021B49FA3|nr:transposase [Paenibacillus xylanexedens]
MFAKYSPELNPVEDLWKWLKQDIVNNVFFRMFYVNRSHVTKSKFINHNQPLFSSHFDRLILQVYFLVQTI